MKALGIIIVFLFSLNTLAEDNLTDKQFCEPSVGNISNLVSTKCGVFSFLYPEESKEETQTRCSGTGISQKLCINEFNCPVPSDKKATSLHIRGGLPLQCYSACYQTDLEKATAQFKEGTISEFDLVHTKYKNNEADFIELYDAITKDFEDSHKELIDELASIKNINRAGEKVNELKEERFAHLFSLGLEAQAVDKIIVGYTLAGEIGEANLHEQAAVYAIIKNRSTPLPANEVTFERITRSEKTKKIIKREVVTECRSRPSKEIIRQTTEVYKKNYTPNSCDKFHNYFRNASHSTNDTDSFQRVLDKGNAEEKAALNNILSSINNRFEDFEKEENQSNTDYNQTLTALQSRQFSFWNYDNFKKGKRVRNSPDQPDLKRSLLSPSAASNEHSKNRTREKLLNAFKVIDLVDNDSATVKFNNRSYASYRSVTQYATPNTRKKWTNKKVDTKVCLDGKKNCKKTNQHIFYRIGI